MERRAEHVVRGQARLVLRRKHDSSHRPDPRTARSTLPKRLPLLLCLRTCSVMYMYSYGYNLGSLASKKAGHIMTKA